MERHDVRSGRWTWMLSLAAALTACGEGAPPFDELPLRDALVADPSALLALTEGQRHRLGERMESARVESADDPALTVADLAPAAQAREIDRAREREGQDAFVAGVVTSAARSIDPAPLRDEVREGAPGGVLPAVEGIDEAPTSAAERRALEGHAGAVLAALLRRANATRLVRVTSWPVGAVAIDGTVYVNGAWLLAQADTIPQAPVPVTTAPETRTDPTTASPWVNKGSADGGTTPDAGTGSSSSRECRGCECEPCRETRCDCGLWYCYPCERSTRDCECKRTGERCAVAPQRDESRPHGAVDLIALLAPLAWLLRRARRAR